MKSLTFRDTVSFQQSLCNFLLFLKQGQINPLSHLISFPEASFKQPKISWHVCVIICIFEFDTLFFHDDGVTLFYKPLPPIMACASCDVSVYAIITHAYVSVISRQQYILYMEILHEFTQSRQHLYTMQANNHTSSSVATNNLKLSGKLKCTSWL